MEFFVFSDESGRWNWAGDPENEEYYVRSWIKITPEQNKSLESLFLNLKKKYGFKELKWSNFKRNTKNKIIEELKWSNFKQNTENKNIDYVEIFKPDFKVFITISKPQYFLGKDYRIIATLNSLSEGDFTGDLEIRTALKGKFINSARMVLFLNYYEKQHIENSVNALLPKAKPESYKYFVDTPQFLDKDWRKVAKECGISNVEIIKESGTSPGIELADVICGCARSMMENNSDEVAKYIYKKYIKPKMLSVTDKNYPNPNLIFYDNFSEGEKHKLNIFR